MPLLSDFVRRALLAGLTVLAMAAHAAPAASPKPPIEAFFENPVFSGAKISPSGKYLAAIVAVAGRRDALAVVDLTTFNAAEVARIGDTDIGKFQWVSDDRLLFSTVDKSTGVRDIRFGPGLFAVDRDGKRFRQLAKRTNPMIVNGDDTGRKLLPWHTFMLDQEGRQDSEYVYVADANIASPGILLSTDLLRLNTLTGRTETVEHVDNSQSWLLDSKGEPRVATALDKGRLTIHYRDPATQSWRALASFAAYIGDKGSFRPLAFTPDGNLYVVSNARQDKNALYRYDLATNTLADKPLVSLEEFDFHGHLIMNDSKLLGVRMLSDADTTIWFDPAMKRMQEDVDARLPGMVNLISLPVRPETPWVLVVSYSDKQPRTYRVFNTETKRMSIVGSIAPRIRPADMGSTEFVNYAARDGLNIPAWLTLPPGGSGKNLPMVVLVHGGPYVRGATWNWDAEAQFLASRGYAVLRPEFRGSTGFGRAHFRAGLKQWGLKMQDDVADGAKWAIAQGVADPKRICIAGASYGGYATLMGLINDPGLYKCGIDWAGVTDINLMYGGSWFYSSDLPEGWKQYGMPQLIGDQVKDAEQLKATSPLLQAARIKQPLLLAYGGADKRVTLNHGLKFRDAVKAGNPDVEWIEYPEEGHGWHLPANRIDFWTRVEKFLDRNIGKP